MLKDHDILPQLMQKEDLVTLVRLINTKADRDIASSDLSSVTYLGFLQLITQLALNCFVSAKPTFEMLQALINTFHQAVKSRKLSTALYEDNNGANNQKEKDLIAMLTAKLDKEPTYPLPDGYTKVKEKGPVVVYEVPSAMAEVMGEAKTMSVLVIDDLLGELFGVHILEGWVKIEDRLKVKKTFIQQQTGMAEAQALEIMRRFEDENRSTPSQKAKLNPIDGDTNFKSAHRNGQKSENSTERQNNAAMKSRAELQKLKEIENQERERKRAERAKKLKTELA